MSNKTVYLSGPITGLNYSDARYGWRAAFLEHLSDTGGDNITVLSPMRHEGHLAEMKDVILPDNLPNHFFSHPRVLAMKDFLDIKRSDIVLVNLLEAKSVSQGTLIEIGYAYALGKPLIVVREEGNVHNSPFIEAMADVILPSLYDAAIVTKSLLSEGI